MPGQYDLGDLSNVIGGDLYNSLFSSLGFEGVGDGYGGWGDKTNPWMTENGTVESGAPGWAMNPNQTAMDSVNGYTFNWSPEGSTAGTLSGFNPKGEPIGSWRQKGDDWFTKAVDVVAPSLASWAFGGVLSPMFGGGIAGSAAGYGLSNGTMAAAQGGSFSQGALQGAVSGGLSGLAQGTPSLSGNNPSAFVPGTPGQSLAGLVGLDKGVAADIFNKGAGATLGGLVSGKSVEDSLKSGLTSAAIGAGNSLGQQGMSGISDIYKQWLSGSGSDSFDSLQGSMGDTSGQTDVSPNRYAETISGIDGQGNPMEYTNPDYRYAGDQQGNTPQQTIQSVNNNGFSLPTMLSSAGRGIGNFALNNAGDLASMLYGFYNNRRQQQALGSQISSLQNLYGQNSPYAQQLRNTIAAKAAQQGQRSNIAGREVQLQAALADRYAQLQPSMLQMNLAKGQLQNSLGSNTLSMLNKMGAFQGLAGMFGPSTTTIPYNNGNVSGSDIFGWKGSGGM